METPTPSSKGRRLVVGGVATIVALGAAIGASAGISSATAADTPSTAAPTQEIQRSYPAPDDRGPGGEDCPDKDGGAPRESQDESSGQGSSATPAPAPEL